MRRAVAQPLLAVGFVGAVLLVGLLAYPICRRARRSTGGGSDADDAVLLVIDGIRDGARPLRRRHLPRATRPTGPGIGALVLPVVDPVDLPARHRAGRSPARSPLLRLGHGGWHQAGLVALLLGAACRSGRASGRAPTTSSFACSLVWAARLPAAPADRFDPSAWLVVSSGLVVGALATSRAVFALRPACSPRPAPGGATGAPALVFGGVRHRSRAPASTVRPSPARAGTATTPVQQLLVKSDEDLDALRARSSSQPGSPLAAVVGGSRAAAARAEARVDVLLLAAVATPMSGDRRRRAAHRREHIERGRRATTSSTALVLAAYWFTNRLLPEPPPALRPRPG